MPGQLPLYQSLANTLEQHIHNGDWTVGSALPSEAALSKRFKASRHTLRHALQILEANGLIFRRQGAPTQVISRQKLRKFTQSFNSPVDILSYPRNTYRVNLVEEFIELSPLLSETLGCALGSSWYHIGGVRKLHDSADIIASTDIYILPQFSSLSSEPEHTQVMVFEQIEKKYDLKINRASLDVYAAAAPPEIAQRLNLKKNHPCLVIIRRYFDNQDRVFEATVTYHPQEKYIYSMEFKASTEI